MKKFLTYKSSGVNIDEANRFVDGIGPVVRATMRSGVIRRPGSFGSLFAVPKKYKDPVMVSSTDGVGTKLLIAQALNQHESVGVDLVAMNVNDILCTGAEPLFFLDYVACGEVRRGVLTKVVKGIAEGCRQAGCSLIGGETAEMPGMYESGEYDLAGFAVGVVERKELIDGSQVKTGDVMVGLPSNGLHSNGFSLVRSVFSATQQKRLARELLAPTRIYAREVMALVRQARLKRVSLKAIAHVTGGAYYDKLTKVLPKGKCFEVRKGSWPVPGIFNRIQAQGGVQEEEMYRTFNMGIGLVIVASAKDVPQIQRILQRQRTESYIIGRVTGNLRSKIVFI